jgi:plasmid stability protein
MEDHMATLNVKNLPDPLYRKLKARARAHHRSVAQELTHLLSELLNEPQPLSILELRGLGKATWAGVEPARHVAEERASWD